VTWSRITPPGTEVVTLFTVALDPVIVKIASVPPALRCTLVVIQAGNLARGSRRPWAPDPNGQGMGRLFRP
jgi:hypothetical protein